jgi:excisionase family DNA binding protein
MRHFSDSSHSSNHASSAPATDSSYQGDLLTVEQAAAYLHLSASSIRSSIREGSLKAFRVAGLRKVLISRTALHALLQPTISESKARTTSE